MYRLPLLACLCLGCALTPAWAGDTWWQHDPATPGDWFKPANWTAGVPGPADYAYVDNAGTAHIGTGIAAADRLYLGYTSTGAGTIQLVGAELESSSSLCVGYDGLGIFAQAGGTNIADSLTLASNAHSTGLYYLMEGEVRAPWGERIGRGGAGCFTQTGGTNSTNHSIDLGFAVGSLGTYELSGGEVRCGSLYIGEYGTGVFAHTGGSNVVGYSVVLGQKEQSMGTYQLSADGQLSAVYETVGWSGRGQFTQTGGSNTVGQRLLIGDEPGSHGTYRLDGTGQLAVGNEIRVGSEGTGRFEWYGGVLDTPTLGLSGRGTLAMGYDFDVSDLFSAALLANPGVISGLQVGTVEVTNQATATHVRDSFGFGNLRIESTGRYELTRGTLEIAAGLHIEGELDCAGSKATINAGDNSLVDLCKGRVLNAGQATLAVGANSLTIYAAGAHPSDLFGSFETQGMTHRAGKTLVIPARKG
ncbi:MAG: hypothetical protein AMJ81_10310, partial [Phycisphaerae bacterium SM23_33]